MSPIARQRRASLEEGTVVHGHSVDRALGDRPGPEVRYAVRAPDGGEATLVTSRRPYAGRRARALFRRLAERRARLEHPAVIGVRVVTERAHHPVLIADPYPECTFGDLLRHDAPLDAGRVVTMLAPVAEALDRAAASGLVHRTLGADSLLLIGYEALMLDTFGVVAPETPQDPLEMDTFGVLSAERTGWSIFDAGDLAYQSPEQVRGLPLGEAAGIYSLTGLVVHALTGAEPYAGDRRAMRYAHLAEPPPRVSERNPELGGRIDDVVAWGMAKEPSDRPASASELIGELAAAAGVRTPAFETMPPRRRLHSVSAASAATSAPAPAEEARAGSATEEAARAASAPGDEAFAGSAPGDEALAGSAPGNQALAGSAPVRVGSPAVAGPRPARRRARLAAALVGAVVLAAACGAVVAAATTPFGGDEPAATPRPVNAAAWARLEEQRAGLREQLASAHLPSAQADAAGELAALYSSAGRAGARALVAPARDAASAYARLAAAARNGDRRGWAAATRAARESEARLSLAASRH